LTKETPHTAVEQVPTAVWDNDPPESARFRRLDGDPSGSAVSSLSSNQVSAPGIRAPLCGSHLSLVVLITGTLTLAVVLPSPDSSHDDE
jgi:hypothetical protein